MSAESRFDVEQTLRRLMRGLGRLMPGPDSTGENPAVVRAFDRVQLVRDALAGGPLRRAVGRARGRAWPGAPGVYVVGDTSAPVAVCALTSSELLAPVAALPGVAIAGQLHTVNLGIERIIVNVCTNPAIRFLLVCGVESPLFRPAQGLRALLENGVTDQRRIVGADGHLPVLNNTDPARIAAFRRQIELIDHTGETDLTQIAAAVRDATARAPGRFADPATSGVPRPSTVTVIQPGGRRQRCDYDPFGYFVIAVDRPARKIEIGHYLPDNTPAHVMRGHSAEAMLRGLVSAGLVSQLSHAGYLGAELAKAETALRLGIGYEQDRPLRSTTGSASQRR